VRHLSQLNPEDFLVLAKARHNQRLRKLRASDTGLEEQVRAISKLLNEPSDSFWAILPDDLTVREYVWGTSDESSRAAVVRMKLCDKCPTDGGACDKAEREGEVPFWNRSRPNGLAPALEWRGCPRWSGHLIDRRMLKWGFPVKLMRNTLDSYDVSQGDQEQRENLQVVTQYCNDFHRYQLSGKGLMLCGDIGSGKTHLVVAVCRELLLAKKIRSARFWDVTQLLTVLRKGENEEQNEVTSSAMRTNVLVLDDIGAHKTSDWVREQVGMIVNYRWSNNLPMLVTTNESMDTIAQSFGARVASRLEEAVLIANICAPDHRLT
jgi:DNA replication protein DnaC